MGEPVQAAADDDGAGPAGGVHGQRVDVAGGGHLVRTPSRARAAEADVELARGGVLVEGVHQPEVAGALVDHAGAVAGGVAGVELLVVGVAAQAGAVGQAGVEVADALVVGEEGDAAADEHRRVQVPLDVLQQAHAVQPEPAGGAAAVALPGRGLVRWLAGEQQAAVLAVDVGHLDVGDRAPGQAAAGAAVGGQLVGPGVVRERLPVGGDGEDVAVGVPAADAGVGGAPVAEPARRAAVHGGQVDLGVEAAPGGEGDVPSVGGETGVADPGAVDGDPPGPARGVAVGDQGGDPEVVLGGEAQQFVVEVREAEVRDVVTHPTMLSASGGPGNSYR